MTAKVTTTGSQPYDCGVGTQSGETVGWLRDRESKILQRIQYGYLQIGM